MDTTPNNETPDSHPNQPNTPNDETPPNDTSEYDKLYSDPDLTPEKLNDKLNDYARAYQQEFETRTQAQPEDVELHTRDFFKRNVHCAAAQVVWLSSNADSETVRLNASKAILAYAFEDAKNDGDPFKQLMRELTSKPLPTSK